MLKKRYKRFFVSSSVALLLLAAFWVKDSFFIEQDSIAVYKDQTMIEIELNEWSITPELLTVEKGERIKMSVVNMGSSPHDFAIPELEIKTKKLNSGEQQTLTFLAEKDMSIIGYCTLPGHKELGMVTELNVK
jgi:uncharacterized cupredoxin-like copper-binding protein